VSSSLAGLEAMQGRFDEHALYGGAGVYGDLGLRMPLVGLTQVSASSSSWPATDAAERELRQGYDELLAMGPPVTWRRKPPFWR
jgi:hypothetical protein